MLAHLSFKNLGRLETKNSTYYRVDVTATTIEEAEAIHDEIVKEFNKRVNCVVYCTWCPAVESRNSGMRYSDDIYLNDVYSQKMLNDTMRELWKEIKKEMFKKYGK